MSNCVARTGTAGWESPGLIETFYPEDMPEDWRLAYYCMHFDTVWLPRSFWVNVDREKVAGWLAEVPSQFRFVLEGPIRTATEEAALADYGQNLTGCWLVDHPGLIWFDAGVDLRQLAAQLRAASADQYLLSRDGDLSTMTRVSELVQLIGLGAQGAVV